MEDIVILEEVVVKFGGFYFEGFGDESIGGVYEVEGGWLYKYID